jgi:hypothetical protein
VKRSVRRGVAGAQDFRSGQKFDHIVFFGENVDIHHIFPKKWCEEHGIKPAVYDSTITGLELLQIDGGGDSADDFKRQSDAAQDAPPTQ